MIRNPEKAILDSVQRMEKQLMQHYELASKKAEMQEEQRSIVLKNLDAINAELKGLVFLNFDLPTQLLDQ